MRQISGELLHGEITRLGAVVVQTWMYHPSGVLLHAPGDILTAEHAAVFEKAVLDRVFLAEAGEDRKAALAAGGVSLVPLAEVKPEDALAEEVVAPNGRARWKAAAALEPPVLEAMAKEKVASVPVSRGATAASLKWARTYLELAPAAAPKAARPDPAAGGLPWGLLTPRARVVAIFPDDMARLRVVNGLLAAGHEVSQSKLFSELPALVKTQRPDVVVIAPDGAVEACSHLRKKGETLRAMVIAVCGEPAKLATAGPKALEMGVNDLLPLPVTPGILADRVRSWLRLRNKECALPMSIPKERRTAERRAAALTIRLSDPVGGKPVPVTSATMLEMSDAGLKFEYGLLEPSDPGDYKVNGVHPRHPLWPWARENPAGRNLLVSLTGRDSLPFESPARIAHLNLVTGSERVGLSFVKRQEGVAARVTTIQRRPPG